MDLEMELKKQQKKNEELQTELETNNVAYWTLNDLYLRLENAMKVEVEVLQRQRDFKYAENKHLNSKLNEALEESEKYKMLWKRECECFRVLEMKYDDWLDTARREKDVE